MDTSKGRVVVSKQADRFCHEGDGKPTVGNKLAFCETYASRCSPKELENTVSSSAPKTETECMKDT